MIPIIFDSMTGNVKRFAEKIPFDRVYSLNEAEQIDEPFILITYTKGFGNIPESTEAFLEDHAEQLLAVASSGNKVWGDNFAKSANQIAVNYNVPILHKFELSGTKNDVSIFAEEAMKVATNTNHRLDPVKQ
ncbi:MULTISPECIES: class Ib ribonucleoside-diphosphate reductase assembly flavoprotein NrdI [Marinococcus]|jgi:protein involved in ribonucleotide reduction|uniref:Protein involved in ribonucleotide reduction n=2 Tax=Marinococcus TaxID=1370 RepID=A0A1H2XIG2_9BACI|nr:MULTISPECIES: class Ib ribonucleoside-diphosphate reductase assembly flavoprotein NrdI [Marinococcus]MDX6151792.1 class Ib ribonucleoside-diphosphate reductase assembly flavoprotein NrdI [Marinococcus sp. PL1-022]OZT78922.1 class Ib ribonucleoside-diphosphate reductase assembly flavoprotein NrdI [Marinococcus halophilus]GEK60090.1 protein NrdI [Marinococcus halophilus]SDW92576.1 protein involved in ribonucleotide reduction [Marinococcus luteus]